MNRAIPLVSALVILVLVVISYAVNGCIEATVWSKPPLVIEFRVGAFDILFTAVLMLSFMTVALSWGSGAEKLAGIPLLVLPAILSRSVLALIVSLELVILYVFVLVYLRGFRRASLTYIAFMQLSASLLIAALAAYMAGLNEAASMLVLAALVVEAGLIPFNAWVTNVFRECSGDALALMLGFAGGLSGYVSYKILTIIDYSYASWASAYIYLALVTLFACSLTALTINSIREVIAYLTVAHGATLVLALASLPYTRLAAYYVVVAEVLAKTLLSYIPALLEEYFNLRLVDEAKYIASSSPILGFISFSAFACIAGIPPYVMLPAEALLITSMSSIGFNKAMLTALACFALAAVAGYIWARVFWNLSGVGKVQQKTIKPEVAYPLITVSVIALLLGVLSPLLVEVLKW